MLSLSLSLSLSLVCMQQRAGVLFVFWKVHVYIYIVGVYNMDMYEMMARITSKYLYTITKWRRACIPVFFLLHSLYTRKLLLVQPRRFIFASREYRYRACVCRRAQFKNI